MMGIPREAEKFLEERQYKLIIGTLLGDSCFLKPHNWGVNYRLQVNHSDSQKDYVFWKYNELKEWVLTEPKFIKHSRSWRFRTRSHPVFTVLAQDFYRNSKKVIPHYVFDFMTDPLVLAVWYMDDGCVRRYKEKIYYAFLNTHSFTKEEIMKIAETIKKKLDIEMTLEINHDRWRLRIAKKDVNKFIKIVKPHILPSLYYKISLAP